VPTLAAIFPPTQAPERLNAIALAAEAAGLAQLWVWEDCFSESGIATATAILAATDRVTVGIGLLPVPLRNAAESDADLEQFVGFLAHQVAPLVDDPS
jgi:alkanesulfonate monooxygenase SsuD/methylene tetrahydromethanopterin reductase-like flavin-dependent oxidoreductase (luciferase family)